MWCLEHCTCAHVCKVSFKHLRNHTQSLILGSRQSQLVIGCIFRNQETDFLPLPVLQGRRAVVNMLKLGSHNNDMDILLSKFVGLSCLNTAKIMGLNNLSLMTKCQLMETMVDNFWKNIFWPLGILKTLLTSQILNISNSKHMYVYH